MEEGDFRFQPGISVRLTAAPEGADIDWDALDQILLRGDISSPEGAIDDASSSPNIDLDGVDLDELLLSGDISCHESAIDASSSPNLFASPSTIPSDATTTTAATNTLLSQPNTCSSQPGAGVAAQTMASQGAMVGLGSDAPDQLLSGDNPWLQVTTIPSSSSSLFDPPSTFPVDATTNRGTPGITNTCLIQSSISVPSSQGAAVDLDDLLEQMLSADNACPDVPTHASSSASRFASPSISMFPSDATETTTASATPSGANTGWIQASPSVHQRVTQALTCIRETQRNSNVLAQLWVPVKDGDGRLRLTTAAQPFTVDQSSMSLTKFRDESKKYWFFADVAPAGLAGRVYMGKLPDWSPDVVQYYFTDYEWPMVRHAQHFGIHAALELPVFEKGNYTCLGVIQFISIHGHNLFSGLGTICNALQAVNLTTTYVSSIPFTKFNTASYEEAIPEILQVLKAACIIHKLPLAQTWATCPQHREWGKLRHSDENRQYCISTINVACYVNEPRVQIFHKACSEHHLLLGQGVVGKAFATNQPCFISDIGSSVEQEYPLSDHAKIFRLRGAVAIRLRCTHTRMADFVLEFFLPTDCGVLEEQKAVLDSLWGTVWSLSRTLRMVTDKEMEDDAVREMNEINSLGLQRNKKPMKRKRMARRSPVWNDFTEVIVGDIVKAKCNHCGLELCCDSKTHGTSSLKSHLERCKLNPNNRVTGPL